MRKRMLILFLAGSLLYVNTALCATVEQVWNWQREITTDQTSRFSRIEISLEIYAKSQLNLGDLRIMDDQGTSVPYILDTPQEITQDVQNETSFKLTRTFRKKNDTTFDFEGTAPAGTDLALNHLTVDLGYEGDFFKYVEVYGSYDGTHWESIGTDTLYRVEESLHDGFSLNTVQKYTFYRIVILESIEGITLKGLSGSLINNSAKLTTRDLILSPGQYARTENGTTTEISLKGFRNLPVRTLSIDAVGLFHRPCRVVSSDEDEMSGYLGSGYLYQSTLKGTEPLKNSLAVRVSQPYDTLLLSIENADNPPLKIQSITLEYAADTLIFEPAKGKTYRLVYGNPTAPTPQYDLEQFKSDILQQTIDTATLLTEVEVKKPAEVTKVNLKAIFSVVIFAVAVLLAWLAIRGMKKA
ncbi:MAG: DUF3999 family protein [Caldiserica bacterium]|nr:DUF3999 family protein [Caldisericota bacterium]